MSSDETDFAAMTTAFFGHSGSDIPSLKPSFPTRRVGGNALCNGLAASHSLRSSDGVTPGVILTCTN